MASIDCQQEGGGEAEQICTDQLHLSVFRSNLCASCVTILPLKDSVRHTASLMYCDDTTLCVSATSAPAAVKATTAMMTPPTTAVMTPPTTAVMTPPTTAVMTPITTTAMMAPTTTAVVAPTTTAVMATATENDSI